MMHMNTLINVIGTIVLCFSLGLFIVTIIMFTHEILFGYSEDDEGEDAIDKLIKVVGVFAFCSLIVMLSVFVGVFIHRFWTDDSDDVGDAIVFDEEESRTFVFDADELEKITIRDLYDKKGEIMMTQEKVWFVPEKRVFAIEKQGFVVDGGENLMIVTDNGVPLIYVDNNVARIASFEELVEVIRSYFRKDRSYARKIFDSLAPKIQQAIEDFVIGLANSSNEALSFAIWLVGAERLVQELDYRKIEVSLDFFNEIFVFRFDECDCSKITVSHEIYTIRKGRL